MTGITIREATHDDVASTRTIADRASPAGRFGGCVATRASDDGRPLYESLGFEPTNEMRINLK